MLARIRKSAEHKDSGFTLIELLVVMIIIGILAAIAIPAFLSQKNKARSTSAKADVSTIGKEIASYYVDSPCSAVGAVSTTTGGDWSVAFTPDALTGKLSQGNKATGTVTNSENWCVTVWNADVETSAATTANAGKATWSYSFANGLVKGGCGAAATTPTTPTT